MKLPYPIRGLRRATRVEPAPTAVEESDQRGILQALRRHLDSAVPFPSGKTVLEVGASGLLAESWLQRNLPIVKLEPAETAVALEREFPNLQVRVGGVRDEMERGAQYDAILCHNILNREENPSEWLLHLATVATGWLYLEIAVCDAEQPVIAAPDDLPPTYRCYPSPSYVANALERAGFPYVYAPVSPPQHPEFRVRWKNNLAWRRGGRPLRCVFVASKRELYLPALFPLLIPQGDSIHEKAKPRPSPWSANPWPVSGGQAPTDEELAEACQDLAYLRPLVPYPGYKFDSDWNNRDLAFRMRRKIWTYCLEQRRHPSVEFPWHLGLRLRLNFANDLSKQLYVGGCYDPNEFAFLDNILEPGMTFIDAGANEGLYALFAAMRVGHSGRVLAFEPSAREFSCLKANVELNRLENITLFSVALAEMDGEADLLITTPEHAGQNTLGAFAHSGVGEERREKVAVRSLDNLLAEEHVGSVDLVKIDVEGAELGLLEGSSETLRQRRPLLLIEIHSDALAKQGRGRTELLHLLESLDYLGYAFEETTGLPAPCAGSPPEGNILFVPRGRDLPERIFESAPYYTRRPLVPYRESGP